MSDLFGKAFREARLHANLSIGEVARLLGFSVPYVSDVERGQRAPFAPLTICIAAQAFDVDSTGLLRLAIQSRGHFTLPAGPTERHLEVAAILCLRWSEMSERQLQALLESLRPTDAG